MNELRVVPPRPGQDSIQAVAADPEAAVVATASLDADDVFTAMVRLTRMPMLVCDPAKPDCPIVFLNDAFLRMTGYEREEVIGRNCRFLQGPGTDPEAVQRIRACLAAREPVMVTLANYRRDGSEFWNALAISPIFDQQNHLTYFVASLLDVTEQHSAEQAARWSRKMEAIGQLTAGVAHDFNNSLQVILGNLSRAKHQLEAGDPPTAMAAIERAATAGRASAKLTQQMLAFARRQKLAPQALDLSAVVRDFSEVLRSAVGSGVHVVLDLCPHPLPCRVDPTIAGTALLNLVVNARDALQEAAPDSPQPPGRITIATEAVQLDEAEARGFGHDLPAGRYAAFSVTDTGAGMAPEVLIRATEPFFTTKAHGTGLGLSMVHGFATQSGGRTEIRSEPGQGTTVRLLFPELTGPASPDPSPPHGGEARETILVVDDDESVRATAVETLDDLDYLSLEAASGEEALELLATHPEVSLVLSDVMMPGGMNGIVLAQRVRQMRSDLPVVLATGYYEELQERGDQTHGITVLHKPYGFRELSGALRRALMKRTKAPA